MADRKDLPVIGLDHSLVADATMRDGTASTLTSQMESLAPDDIAGACAIYETAPVRPMQQTEPVPPATPSGGAKGCALHSPSDARRSSGSTLFAALAAAAARLRRTRRGRVAGVR